MITLKVLAQFKNKNMLRDSFTILELLVVIVIIGVLASLAIPQYKDMVEKSRGSEAHAIFKKTRDGYSTRRSLGECMVGACGWNPNVGTAPADPASDASWHAIFMDNPNSDPLGLFNYDVWEPGFSQTNCPVNADRYVIVATRKGKPFVGGCPTYWLYMDLDTGEIFASRPY